MSDEDHPPYDFVPGLDLSKALYEKAVKPVIERHFPNLVYSAARIGTGSDVLGFDTPQSMDHDWGPKLQIFLTESDYDSLKEEVDETLRQNLPYEIRGFPTNFSFHDDGTTRMELVDYGPVNHGVKINTVSAFFIEYLGFNPTEDLRIIDWLVLPQQMLLSIANGRVFHDGLGKLEPIVTKLEYYPHDLWLYLLANQWERIAQEEAFMGRCGQVGDELGSRIVATRLIRDIMGLCFLIERKYAPYIKWFGTAFSKLKSAQFLTPVFMQIMDASTWQERQDHLTRAYEHVAKMHNDLGITAPLGAKVSRFHNRPFMIIQGDNFADAIHAMIEDDRVKRLPKYLGGIDQYVDSTDVLSYTEKFRRFWSMYQ
ncbi:MAG: hypothetical protein AM326_02825 [Candidatus Thorarchaeota archaeon SMTZ-45]|nr:MAG: hypothetical protein AM326_02825 [Candidatus Thorarchaeota archaeon SMTZ-45]